MKLCIVFGGFFTENDKGIRRLPENINIEMLKNRRQKREAGLSKGNLNKRNTHIIVSCERWKQIPVELNGSKGSYISNLDLESVTVRKKNCEFSTGRSQETKTIKGNFSVGSENLNKEVRYTEKRTDENSIREIETKSSQSHTTQIHTKTLKFFYDEPLSTRRT